MSLRTQVDAPLCDQRLHLSLTDRYGVKLDKFGDADTRLEI